MGRTNRNRDSIAFFIAISVACVFLGSIASGAIAEKSDSALIGLLEVGNEAATGATVPSDTVTPADRNGIQPRLDIRSEMVQDSDSYVVVDNGFTVRYHLLTQDEMEGLNENVGARGSATDYNVIIDGHGTGLAPPAQEEWEKAVGSLKVVDSLSPLGDGPGASFDISSDPYFPAVGNQGGQGSCAAWAMTYYDYGYLEARDNLWADASSGNPDHLMSPAWTYNKVNGGGSGSWMSDNGRIIKDWGTATLAAMPYNDGDSISWGSQAAWRVAPLHRANEVYLLSYSGNGTGTVNSVKNLLANHVPVTFAIDAHMFGPSFSDGDYIMSAVEYTSTSSPNHAQTFVGYDDSISEGGEVGAFKVVNSWGTNDGYTNHGYYWMTYDCFKKIGSKLFLTYITDKPSYVPTMLSIWHFNSAPTRNANIQVGIGSHGSPLNFKSPYYEFYGGMSMPTFMCLDISEFEATYHSGTEQFYLEIGSSTTAGTISSFRIEHYDGGYVLGIATQISPQSFDVPRNNPGYVTVDLQHYPPMSIGSGLDNATLSFSGLGIAHWVSVNHHYYADGDSVQSGDIGDSAFSSLSTVVDGPVTLSFYWKVSSQVGKDFLSLFIDSAEIVSISGQVDWQHVNESLSEGAHTIKWQYSKDDSMSSGEDCGWVDMVGSYAVQPDITPPTTSVSLSGTYGSNDWYRSSVAVTMSASDGGGRGVKYTIYSIDGSFWKTYGGPFNVSTAGQHSAEYYSVDYSGNTEVTKSKKFNIDIASPSTESILSGTKSASGWYSTNVVVSLTASDAISGVQYTTYRIVGGAWRPYLSPVVLSSDGNHEFEYFSVDVAGNSEIPQSLSVKIDKTAPKTTASLTGVSGRAGWFVSDVNLTLNASGDVNGINTISYRIDGGAWSVYSHTFNISENGKHIVEYYSVDAAGNTESTKSTEVWLDKIAPVTLRELSGTSGSTGWYKSPVVVNFSSFDAQSGLNTTMYRVDRVSWVNFTAPFAVTGDGEHSIEYYSLDEAGNHEQVKTTTVGIDMLAPTGTASLKGTEGSNGWYVSEAVVSLTVTDGNGSGISSIMYEIDGSQWSKYEGQFEISESGTHNLSFYSVDFNGNGQVPVVMTVKIDKDSPVLLIAGNSDKVSATSRDVPIEWSSSDSVSSLGSIQVKIDDRNFVIYPASQTNITLKDLSDGQYMLTIRAVDGAGNVAEKTLTLTINTNPFDLKGPMGPWLIVGIVVLLLTIMIVAAVYLLASKRKGKQ